MALLDYNTTYSNHIPVGSNPTTTPRLPTILETLINRTMSNHNYNYVKSTTARTGEYDVISGRETISTMTSSVTSLIVTTGTTTLTTEAPRGLEPGGSDSTIMAKMTALLVITAVVLVISYRFVVRLFLGYTDRKDDVLPDGLSDEEEDSAVVKRVPEHYIEI